MSDLAKFINAYKLVWVRAIGYMLVPSVTLFLTKTEDLTGEQWVGMHPFEKGRLFVLCGLTAISALMAHIDQSLAHAREKHEELKAAPPKASDIRPG